MGGLAEKTCVACGAIATTATFPTKASVCRPLEGGRYKIEHLPPPDLCDEDVREAAAGRLHLGWCDSCCRWGLAGDQSPCGDPYMVL